MTDRLVRSGELIAREVGADLFLADQGPGKIHHLNATAAGIWRILEDSSDRATIVEIFGAAFPEQCREQLDGDIAEAIELMLEQGIVERLTE